jgi:glycosyltransferase involved in cell wall biosynthesis
MSTLTQQAFTQTNQLTPKILIIMPAYNVGNKIDITLKQLLKNLTPITNNYEIIIVNDGSQGSSQSSMITKNNRIKIIKHPKNLGKGAAIKTGTKYVTGEYTIIIRCRLDVNLKPRTRFRYTFSS